MKKLLLVLLSLMMASVSYAGVMDGPGAPALSKGDIIIGGKLALGAVYGANYGFIASGEYGVKEGFLSIPNFPTSLGVGASLGYSSYTDKYFTAEYTYSNYLILGFGAWHIDLMKKPEVDTYVIANVGFNFDSFDGPGNTEDFVDSYGGFVFGLGAGIRYYFIPNLAAVGEVGFGMGIIRLGLDFKL